MTPSRTRGRLRAATRRSRGIFLLSMAAWFIALACGVLDGPVAVALLPVIVLVATLIGGRMGEDPYRALGALSRPSGVGGANYRQPSSEAPTLTSTSGAPGRARTAKERWTAHMQMLLLIALAALLLLSFAISSDWNSPGRGHAGADFSINGLGTMLLSVACGVFLFLHVSITTLIVGAQTDVTPRGVAAIHLAVSFVAVALAMFWFI